MGIIIFFSKNALAFFIKFKDTDNVSLIHFKNNVKGNNILF